MIDFEDYIEEFALNGELFDVYTYVEINVESEDNGVFDFDTQIEVTEINRVDFVTAERTPVKLSSDLAKQVTTAVMRDYEPSEQHYDRCVDYYRENYSMQ